jgi:DNA-binding MarR family transcriptional regulator
MSRSAGRSPEGEAATEVVLNTFRANSLFLAAGDVIASAEGLTAARWQVLGALALADRPLTVPQIARRMGLTRQSVQASVKRLVNTGLVAVEDNPDHRRSPLIRLTPTGRTRYGALQRRQARWIDELAAGLGAGRLDAAAQILRRLIERLERSSDDRGTS